MLDDYSYAQSDRDYYAPLAETQDPGRAFIPSSVPPGWTVAHYDVWATWKAPVADMPDQGWKVHVSTRLDRAQHVLDVVADACFTENVNFKHIRAELFFLFMHHKHARREQAGKFVAAFPPTEASARHLMERLSERLRDEDGPYVLTDRRFGESRTVHYRWGGFRGRARLRPDGTPELLVRDASGADRADVRSAAFVLPDGVADPFGPAPEAPADGPIVLHGFEIVRAIRASNAGGTYEGRELATGRRVFVKEARAHNGLHWDGSTAQERLRREHRVLQALSAVDPAIAPEPLAHFREWEHEFLVTEFVEGVPLNRWISLNSPLIQAGRSSQDFAHYYETCAGILADVDRALEVMHAAGYRFGDVNPTNVMVSDAGAARLVDFEAATHCDEPPVLMGAIGFVPPDDPGGTRPYRWDEYAADALALALLMPIHAFIGGRRENLRLLVRDLADRAPVPAALVRRARRTCAAGDAAPGWLPTPEELDGAPRATLERVLEEVRSGVLAMADASRPDRLFPSIPRGWRSNRLGVAYGSAGVLHALHVTGSAIPEAVVSAFRDEALRRASELPPGLHVGSAGVAWVLLELGFPEEAAEILLAARRHPIAARSTTLGEGVAGVALAHLAMHRATGDDAWLTTAVGAADALLRVGDLAPTLGPNDAIGLLHGRSGLALFLDAVSGAVGEGRYVRAGLDLLHAELDRAIELPDGALSFADDATNHRALPYLYAGSAGICTVATRYAAATADERLHAALPRLVADVDKTCTVLPGLYCGLAGLAFALAEHADFAGDERHRRDAERVAAGLAKYAATHPSGLRFLGEGLLRHSADLWSGGAGVLLGLHRVLHGPAGHLFTLDAPRASADDLARAITRAH